MMKSLTFFTALLLLTACDNIGDNPRKYIGNNITEICIDGVVYLIYAGDKKGGITPKVNADFYPYTCPTSPKQEKDNG
ncbi:hypothetical protein [Frederiksenia canicola]